MCLIIRCETDKPISKLLLANMQKRNDDGFGFMFIKDNKIKTYKDHSSDFEKLWEKYEEFKEFNPFIHLRYKTHGEIDWTNTHPYNCGHGIYLMHNGVINVDDSTDKSKSDTWHYIDQLIKPLIEIVPNPHELIRSKKFKKIMEQQLGSNNRMVFGDRGGFVAFGEKNWHKITNEKTGCKDMWVSNTYAWDAYSFDPDPKPVVIKANYTNPQSKYYTKQTGSYIPTTRDVFWGGLEYVQVKGNIYEDEWGNMYFNNGYNMMRRKDLDEEYQKISSTITTSLIVPATKPIQGALQLVVSGQTKVPDALNIVSKDDINPTIETMDEEAERHVGFTQADYDKALVKEWCQRKSWEISTMVYTEPDEAAKVLSYLIENNHHV